MNGRERATVEDALEAAYQNVTAVADGLAEADLMGSARLGSGRLGPARLGSARVG